MAAFGANILALVETYENCLSLLKAFKRRNKDNAKATTDKLSLLRRRLKADRTKVASAYASKLSQSGSRLELGDAKAKTTIAKVLKKLTTAIVTLMQTASTNQSSVLDYNSLMSLSNSSRVEAVKAIDSLSKRLGSKPSRGTDATAASKSAPASSTKASSKASIISSKPSVASSKPSISFSKPSVLPSRPPAPPSRPSRDKGIKTPDPNAVLKKQTSKTTGKITKPVKKEASPAKKTKSKPEGKPDIKPESSRVKDTRKRQPSPAPPPPPPPESKPDNGRPESSRLRDSRKRTSSLPPILESKAADSNRPRDSRRRTASPPPPTSTRPGTTSATTSTSRQTSASPPPVPPKSPRHNDGGPGPAQYPSFLPRRPRMMDRFSVVSVSSDSTKLGEISPRRWWQPVDEDFDADGDEYNVQPMYPLRPYVRPEAKERKFLGLFRRNTTGTGT